MEQPVQLAWVYLSIGRNDKCQWRFFSLAPVHPAQVSPGVEESAELIAGESWDTAINRSTESLASSIREQR